MRSSSIPPWQRIGSGTVVLSAIAIAVFVLFGLGHLSRVEPDLAKRRRHTTRATLLRHARGDRSCRMRRERL